MRVRLAVLLVLTGSLVPAVGKTTTLVDWIVATVTAGPAGARDIEVSLVGRYQHHPGERPTVIGTGSGNSSGWSANVFNFRESRTAIRTTESLGGVDVEILPPAEPHAGVAGAIFELPGETQPNVWFRLLMFTTDNSLEPRVTWGVGSGSIDVHLDMGTGSTAVEYTEGEGAAVAVGNSVVGDVSITRDLPTGIVGAFDDPCEFCVGSWTAPDGTSAAWRSHAIPTGYVGDGYHSFSGPRGTWTWKWTGAHAYLWGIPVLGTGALLAYAPIGDLAITSPLLGGPRFCAGVDAVGEVTCRFKYSGGSVFLGAQATGPIPSTLRAIALDGTVLAECTTPLLLVFPYCQAITGPFPLAIGTDIRCELKGVYTKHWNCGSWPAD